MFIGARDRKTLAYARYLPSAGEPWARFLSLELSDKNKLQGASFYLMVPGTGIEPASREAHAPKACVSTSSTTRA